MAFFLSLQAERIRDTNEPYYNTNARISNWMVQVVSYINKPTDPYFEVCNTIANLVFIENVTAGNTAMRIGSWCENALKYKGLVADKLDLLANLKMRARRIKDELEDGLNERRLGPWFVDYLTYIGYTGDSEAYIWQSQDGSLILSEPDIFIVNEYLPT